MPYKEDFCGIYKIVNTATNHCYVGQSQHVKKRIREHFRLLRAGKHTNTHLQRAFLKYGAAVFEGAVEIVCENTEDLDVLEELFITGDAYFTSPVVYNIADFAKAPMRGKTHSPEVRVKISKGRCATTFDYRSPSYRKTLSDAQMARFQEDPAFVAKLKYLLENDHLSYAERARAVGNSLSSVRRLVLKHKALKGAS